MESPFSWTEAERIVHQAVLDHEHQRELGLCGGSLEMMVCNALRAAGLLPPYEAPDNKDLTVNPEPAKFGFEVENEEDLTEHEVPC